MSELADAIRSLCGAVVAVGIFIVATSFLIWDGLTTIAKAIVKEKEQ